MKLFNQFIGAAAITIGTMGAASATCMQNNKPVACPPVPPATNYPDGTKETQDLSLEVATIAKAKAEAAAAAESTSINGGNTLSFAQRAFTTVLGLGNASAKGELRDCSAMRGFNVLGLFAWTGEATMIEGCLPGEIKKVAIAGGVIDPNIGMRVKAQQAAGNDMTITEKDKETIDLLRTYEVAAQPTVVPIYIRESAAQTQMPPCTTSTPGYRAMWVTNPKTNVNECVLQRN